MTLHKTPYYHCETTDSVVLTSPTVMPKAAGFLWNKKMMLQMNCRGYAVAQFMQPEPTKYSTGPALEATTFMQPEHHYHAQHPGRFFYVKTQAGLYSLPFEPVRKQADLFEFVIQSNALVWNIQYQQLLFTLKVELVPDNGVEYWTLEVKNLSDQVQCFELYPYFSIGYLSWMNQSASFVEELNGVVGHKITPYQKLEDYFKLKHLKERTFLISDSRLNSWCANAAAFEGWGGLHAPDGILADQLSQQEAKYEVPTAVLQQSVVLNAGQSQCFRYMFGAAKSVDEIYQLKTAFLHEDGASRVYSANASYDAEISPALTVDTPDAQFNHFVNKWLPRQLFYHGDVNRLTTDPQTRNYLQDAMGMAYLRNSSTKQALLTALSQQNIDGSMPDGVLLHEDAELKYINQIPHSDHCVWLPICLSAYLNETADLLFLDKQLPFADNHKTASVFAHLEAAMRWLQSNLDSQGLSLIQQGDWCDPMNMVGYQGKGVSAWLSMATSYAWQQWAEICTWKGDLQLAESWQQAAQELNERVHNAFWQDKWYGRGITDAGRLFGTADDKEGAMFLNPQSWAMLSKLVNAEQAQLLVEQIQANLDTPYGPVMLEPAFTAMVEDIGRVTQKYPGSAENGSVYNHAAAFYAFSLYQYGFADEGYKTLSQMLVRPDDASQRGQLPVFIPNYYRGAWKQHPSHAGRSSHLFNTGTIAWFYRTLVEGTFGLRGTAIGLQIYPQLPSEWASAKVVRKFRGATFNLVFEKSDTVQQTTISIDDAPIAGNVISNITAGVTYQVKVRVPK